MGGRDAMGQILTIAQAWYKWHKRCKTAQREGSVCAHQDIAVRRPADGPTEGCRVVFENTLVDVNVCHLQVDGTAHRGVAV
eukprot:355187-Chlamydomonas_euryale.AAC.4